MKQNRQIKYIVTDKYQEFSSHDEIITISELIDTLSDMEKGITEDIIYISGQGLSKSHCSMIRDLINNNKHNNKITFIESNKNIVDKKHVHKHKPENVLISAPLKSDLDTFTSMLHIDDNCAETSDHITGQHIQGMVLMEAARQMFIGVTEIYYKTNTDINYYYIFNEIETSFNSFTFPIPVNIIYKVIEHRTSSSGNMEFKVSIEFFQNEKLVTTTNISFSACRLDIAQKLESKTAKKALSTAKNIINNYIEDNRHMTA